MINKEKYKKELEHIKTPEELINKTKNRIESINYEKEKKHLYMKPALAMLCTLIISIIIGNYYIGNNSEKNYKNEKMVENKEYSELFLKQIDENVTEEDAKKIILTIENEEISIENPEMYKNIMDYIKNFTGEYNHNLGKTSKVNFNMEGLKSYYGLYEKDLILVTINKKYIIRIPYKENTAIIIIDLTKEKFTDYTIYPEQNGTSNDYLIELRAYIKKEFELEKIEQQENSEIIEEEQQEDNQTEEQQNTENNTTENKEPEKETKTEEKEIIVPKTYGDVDRNGIIQSRDVSIIKQHVSGNNKITDSDARKAADVNADGLITGADAVLLQYAVVNAIEFDGNSPITAILYGDIDMDGVITQNDYNDIKRHVDGEITLTYTNIADINNDGQVNGTDLILIEGILNKTFDHSNMLTPLTNYTIYGDVDENGKINSRDVTLLKQYLNKTRTLSNQQLKNADVNADGTIDEKDTTLIQEFVVQMHENTLPFKPIK